jgi:hypothetical protein
MLCPYLTTESNATKGNRRFSVTPCPCRQTSTTELFTGEENERQARDESIRLNSLSATSIQIDDSGKEVLINDYKSDPAFSEHVAEPKSPFVAREGMLD